MIYRYENPEIFEGFEKPDFKQYSGNIVLWGAGKIGSAVAHKLKTLSIDFLAFVDINESKHGDTFCEHKIISPEQLAKDYPNAVIIATTIYRSDVFKLFETSSVLIFDAWSLMLEIDWDGYEYMKNLYMERMIDYYFSVLSRDLKLKKKYFVNHLILNITNRCTLRCEECAVFIPYIEHPCDYDTDSILTDAKNIIEAIGPFKELNFFGGEPFLHKDLTELIRSFKDERSFERMCIITNGTILPDEKMIKAMKDEPRIYIRVSDYGKLSSKMDALIKCCQDNGIRCEHIDYKFWYKKAEIRDFNETEKQLRYKFNCCMGASFPCVSNGKLFLCKPAMVLCEMGIFPESSENYLDLINLRDVEKSERNKIIHKYIERMDTDDFIDACRYCQGKPNLMGHDIVPPAVQAKGRLKLDKIAAR